MAGRRLPESGRPAAGGLAGRSKGWDMDAATPTVETQGLVESAVSADGTRVGWERVGSGPPLVVLHGGLRAGKHYRALAAALGRRFSVLLVDRRGRGHSGAARVDDGIDTEVADLAAVLAATGAQRVFGHSAGALIALEAALRLPIRELAVFEPPVAPVPLGWVPAFEAALAGGDHARAMVTLVQGLQMGPTWLPARLLALPVRVLMHTGPGRELAALLETMPRDLHTLRQVSPRPERYAALGCRVLLMEGTGSPAYLRRAVEALTGAIPGAERATLDGVAHNAPDMEAPERVAARALSFFSCAPGS